QRWRMWGQGDANQYWSSEWRPGDLVLGRYDIRVDAQAPAGRYTTEVGVFDRRTGERLALPSGDTQALEAVKVAQAVQPSPDSAGQALELDFGGTVALLGYGVEGKAGSPRLPSRARPGETLAFTLLWKAGSSVSVDYTVFLHLVDASGLLVAQADSQPQSGGFPTSFWDPGEVVADRLQLTIPSGATPGLYTVNLGLYEMAAGRRLPVSAGGFALGDRANLGQVEVAP
ncbi:MAG: hypothetical protein Q8P59_13050, partial [Dehalococcoidia bacterium]|nr:hypothetical protein [Dehalococcoidia bacterium]